MVPCRHIREYRYLYGAVSPLDGEMFSLVMSGTDTVCIEYQRKVSIGYFDSCLSDNVKKRCSSAFAEDASSIFQ